jgi:hypothetical protein
MMRFLFASGGRDSRVPGTGTAVCAAFAALRLCLVCAVVGLGTPWMSVRAQDAATTQAVVPAGTGASVQPADSPSASERPDFQSLDMETQTLKQQVMDLNRELFLLEEELLFPANTQVAVYVSYDVGTFFALDAVQVRIDDKEVANYLYTAREVEALQRGGVHRVWLGNLKVGKHVVTAFFNGKGPHDRDYRTGATIDVEKGVGARYLELKISDRQQKLQPEFIVKQWD